MCRCQGFFYPVKKFKILLGCFKQGSKLHNLSNRRVIVKLLWTKNKYLSSVYVNNCTKVPNLHHFSLDFLQCLCERCNLRHLTWRHLFTWLENQILKLLDVFGGHSRDFVSRVVWCAQLYSRDLKPKHILQKSKNSKLSTIYP